MYKMRSEMSLFYFTSHPLAIYQYIGILGCILLNASHNGTSNGYESAYESAYENAYESACGCACGYRGSYDYPWKSTKTRMKIHFHTNRNFHDGYPYDPRDYYDGLDDVPSCLYDVLDDVPLHWLIDP